MLCLREEWKGVLKRMNVPAVLYKLMPKNEKHFFIANFDFLHWLRVSPVPSSSLFQWWTLTLNHWKHWPRWNCCRSLSLLNGGQFYSTCEGDKLPPSNQCKVSKFVHVLSGAVHWWLSWIRTGTEQIYRRPVSESVGVIVVVSGVDGEARESGNSWPMQKGNKKWENLIIRGHEWPQ